MPKTILITGGAGFIASHLVEHIYRKTDWNIVVIDMLSYASKGMSRLRDNGILNSPRLRVFTFDLCQPLTPGLILEIGSVEYLVHTGAMTHVDESIKKPRKCIYNNVMSTVSILEYARTLKTLELFLFFSTDEIFGPAPIGVAYKEWDRHRPTNPYSASKSAGESICISYQNTYKLPIIILNCMNAFGERQHPEKFIPKAMKHILEGKTLEIHTDAENKPGSRSYIHSRNIASAVLFLIKNGEISEKYNIVGEREVDNLEMAQFIAKVMKKELKYELANNPILRPGHDGRYALDGSKLLSMGWSIPVPFEESLRKTIEWTLLHPEWLEE